MEPSLLAALATGLVNLGAECCGAQFGSGIIGGFLSSLGYDYYVKNRANAALARLRDQYKSGVTHENHDLLRAVWTAQNEALVLACEHVLKVKKGLRPGGLAIPEKLTDLGAWLGTVQDAETRALLALRAAAIRHARRATDPDLAKILPHLAASLASAPELFHAGSEFTPATGDVLRTKTTEQFIEALRRQHPEALQGMHLPTCLEECLRERWFDFLRLAFREVLKTNDKAKSAFEFLVWEKIDGLDLKLDDALRRLEHFDWALDHLYQHVRWLVEAVDVVHREIGAQHAETREQIEQLQRAIEANPRVQQADEKLSAALARLEQKLDYLIGGFPILRFKLPDAPTHELELLHAKQRAVDLVGRDDDLNALEQWLFAGERISVRLVVGGAGTGKTRLAFELLLRVYAQLPRWQAGLVTESALRKFDATKQPTDWTWPDPTLLVVDYAQTLAGPLAGLLRALTHRRGDATLPPLRILLLERQPGDWFDGLLREEESSGPCAVRKLFEPTTPVELTPLPEGELRRRVLAQTLDKAARLSRRLPLTLPPEGQPDYEASLKRDLFAQPLNLMLAAMAASELGLLPALTRTRIELAEALARKELVRIERFARDQNSDAQKRALRHLAGCATMERGFTPQELERAVEEELAALKITWPAGPGDLAAVLRQALRGERLPVAPVEPDFVGEALVLQSLAQADSPIGPDRWRTWCSTVERCCRRDAGATPATLLHTFQNFGHQANYGEPLLAATDAIIRTGLADSKPSLLLGIERALPQQTVELRTRAAEITHHLYTRLKTGLQQGREELRPEVARLAHNLAIRLNEVGRWEEALVTAQEAVELYRAQARQNPDAFGPDLATSLNNLANRLSAVGRREEALVPAQEAVELRRAQARQNADAFGPDLAASLNNLATCLSEVGRRTEALVPAQEAVELRRDLARRNPDVFGPALAGSLNNLANRLSEVGRRMEALVPAQEAVDLYRALAQQNPDAFGPDLAMSLNNLANCLSQLNQRTQALVPAQEAVELRRTLARKNPDAFGPDLAMSLNNLAVFLSDVGRPTEALVPAQEAVELRRALARKNPDAFGTFLATSLNNLANRLSDVGRWTEALVPAQEAVELRRALARRNPDAFGPALAVSLGMFGQTLEGNKRREEALASFAEGVQVLTPYFQRIPAAHAPIMGLLAKEYLRLAEALGQLPDEALLAPVAEGLSRLKSESPPAGS